VVEDRAGRPAACGGFHVNSPERWGGLTWGMVASGEQRRGIGSLLLGVRLERLREEGVNEVRLDASQLSRAFYERHGFVVVSIQPDGYRPGLDRWDMTLSMIRAPNRSPSLAEVPPERCCHAARGDLTRAEFVEQKPEVPPAHQDDAASTRAFST